ncbi:MAG: ribosome biogenesis factor YjgA [Desulfovibrionaceae bacterium]|nr:ribosome biogenesis factor YjgA [Desulfovibrionaceae bacterium]
MPRKKQFQYDQSAAEDSYQRPSRSQRKRDSSALQDLGRDLAELPVRELAALGLAPDLLEAYRELGRISSHEAKRRQMQYIGRLMREEEDVERLKEAVAIFREGLLPSRELAPRKDASPEEEQPR